MVLSLGVKYNPLFSSFPENRLLLNISLVLVTVFHAYNIPVFMSNVYTSFNIQKCLLKMQHPKQHAFREFEQFQIGSQKSAFWWFCWRLYRFHAGNTAQNFLLPLDQRHKLQVLAPQHKLGIVCFQLENGHKNVTHQNFTCVCVPFPH